MPQGAFCTTCQAFVDVADISERFICDAGHVDGTYGSNSAYRHQKLRNTYVGPTGLSYTRSFDRVSHPDIYSATFIPYGGWPGFRRGNASYSDPRTSKTSTSPLCVAHRNLEPGKLFKASFELHGVHSTQYRALATCHRGRIRVPFRRNHRFWKILTRLCIWQPL